MLTDKEKITDYKEVTNSEKTQLEASDAKWQKPTDTFVDLWNEACGKYGKYNADSGYFELNGITDIGLEEAKRIYNAGRIESGDCSCKYVGVDFRTNLPPAHGGYAWGSSIGGFKALSAFDSQKLEVINVDTRCFDFRVTEVNNLGTDIIFVCPNVRKIIGTITPTRLDGWRLFGSRGANAKWLEEVRIWTIRAKSPLELDEASKLSLASLKYMVTTTPPPFATEPLDIYVHPDIYAKITDEANTEWHQLIADAAERKITFLTR